MNDKEITEWLQKNIFQQLQFKDGHFHLIRADIEKEFKLSPNFKLYEIVTVFRWHSENTRFGQVWSYFIDKDTPPKTIYVADAKNGFMLAFIEMYETKNT